MAREYIYSLIIENIFQSKFKPGMREVDLVEKTSYTLGIN